jgi:hypothetical protein
MNPLLSSLFVFSYAAISAYGLYLIKVAPALTSKQALVGGPSQTLGVGLIIRGILLVFPRAQ